MPRILKLAITSLLFTAFVGCSFTIAGVASIDLLWMALPAALALLLFTAKGHGWLSHLRLLTLALFMCSPLVLFSSIASTSNHFALFFGIQYFSYYLVFMCLRQKEVKNYVEESSITSLCTPTARWIK